VRAALTRIAQSGWPFALVAFRAPRSTSTGPTASAPDEGSFYIPGSHFYGQNGYYYRDGYWADVVPGQIWVPARYIWTPYGYCFASGYWDYAFGARGLLFAPVFFARPLWYTPGWFYQPSFAVGFGGLLLLAVGGVAITLVTLRPASRNDSLPYAGLVVSTVALIIALVVARYPVLVPPTLTVYNTVSPQNTLEFLALGIGLSLPPLLFYNWFAHHAFRGKVETS